MKGIIQNTATALVDCPEIIEYALDKNVDADYWVGVIERALKITELRGWLDGADYDHPDYQKVVDELEKLESEK